MGFEHLLAERTMVMGASAIREILKVVNQPGMISLAGGIPAPESFPMEIMSEISAKVIEKYGSTAFQYDKSEGFTPLQEALVPYLARKGIRAQASKIVVTSGSQAVLDAVGKILISPGDEVAVEAPTYLGALTAFNPYQPQYVSMAMDEQGLIPEALEEALKHHPIKLVYLVPTFQNPTGRTLPLERRKQIAEIVQRYNVPLLEDDPYSELRYRGEPLPPIQTFAPDHVIYAGTMSKTMAPGLRIGFAVAPELLRHWMVLVKQGVDLHTSTFAQALAAEYLAGGYLDRHLPKIIDLYRPRQEAMLAALDSYFPAGFNWSQPEGGMFIWAEGPKGLDLVALYQKCIDCKVAYVPGKFFYTEPDQGFATMRLNFTMSDPETIYKAIRLIAKVLGQ